MPKWIPAAEGTLDDPPIVLRQDRVKLSLIALCFMLLATFVCSTGSPLHNNGTLFWTSFFGVVTGCFGWKAVMPGTLALDPAGIVWRTSFRKVKYEWNEFSDFRTYSIKGLINPVLGDFSGNRKSHRIWRNITGGPASFGAFWELPAQTIVDVLKKARSHWMHST